MQALLVILMMQFLPVCHTHAQEYEVDYEEDAVEMTPPPARSSKKQKKESTVQGSIAEKRPVPILPSETKSVYKKNGKALDVDTD